MLKSVKWSCSHQIGPCLQFVYFNFKYDMTLLINTILIYVYCYIIVHSDRINENIINMEFFIRIVGQFFGVKKLQCGYWKS